MPEQALCPAHKQRGAAPSTCEARGRHRAHPIPHRASITETANPSFPLRHIVSGCCLDGGAQTASRGRLHETSNTSDPRKNHLNITLGKTIHLFISGIKKISKKSAFFLLFCIANSNLFRIFVVQTNKVTNL
jgi:hypothetical protein